MCSSTLCASRDGPCIYFSRVFFQRLFAHHHRSSPQLRALPLAHPSLSLSLFRFLLLSRFDSFLIGGDSTRKTPLETPSCLDLFGQRLPVVTSDGVASWSCARWFVRRLSSTAFEIAAARFVSIASDAVRVAEEAGTIAPGTRADRSADEVHRRDGSELCLTATVGGTARAVACARGHGNGALASSLPEQRWSIDPTDGLERSAAFGTAGFPCTVRIKHVGGKCLTRGGPCAMRGMSEAALLKPCDANNARQHWTFAASGAGGVVPCQAGGVAMLPAASDSEGQKRVAMDVAMLRFHCETEAKKEFAGILAQESEAAAVPTESSFSVFRTAGIQEKGAEPCLFADVEGKNNGLATTRAKDGSVLVGSGICVPWEVIPTQHGDAQFRVHGSSAAERPSAAPMCMTVALPGKGCNGVRNGCIVLEPCAFDDGERTHHNRFFRQRFRVGAGTQRVRILKVTSSSSRRGKKCVKWMGWGRPAQIVDCEADDHAQEWTRAPSRLIKKNHVDAYRRFSDVYAPVPPTYLAWLVRSHLASKQASIRAKALAAVAHFTPARYTENLTSIPSGKLSNVFSWSLFIPSGVSNTDLYASLIRKDGKYTAAANRAPKTLAEAKKGTQYSGTSFFGKYVDSMLRGLDYVSRHLPGWGVVVHLDPRLHWLEATLLESGIVRIGIMKEGAIRTSGAFWRWIPFDNKRLDLVIAVDADDCADDTSGTVLAHLWEAVVSWAAEPNSMLHSDRWKEHNTMRWLTGWDRGVVDANCGNVQYAPIQANVLGVKPKLLDYSMRDAMAGYALTRMLNPNVDANTGFTRHQPWQLCHNHPGTNLYPSRKHGFMNGHGCGLWSYGHDELFTKQVVFFRATAAGELWSAIPESATAPEHMMVAHVDEHELRCRNAWYLDAMYSVKTPANPIESDFQHLMQSSAAVFSAPLPANKFFSLVQAIPKFGLLDGNSGMSLEPCSPARGVDQSWDLVAPKWAIGTAEENTVCIHRAGPGGSKVCINTYVVFVAFSFFHSLAYVARLPSPHRTFSPPLPHRLTLSPVPVTRKCGRNSQRIAVGDSAQTIASS